MASDKHSGRSSAALPLAGAIVLLIAWGAYTVFTLYHILAGS